MSSISNFIRNYTPLCVCTLGIAVIGYLGYQAVRWVINKCQGTEKVDQVAQRNIGLEHQRVGKPLVLRVRELGIDSHKKIQMGQGEYVVFHKTENGETKKVAKETFEQIYKILNQYSPAAIINNTPKGSERQAIEACSNRHELIRKEVKKIDPSLEIVFVPRTLYELIFIRKCIEEDLKHNKVCPALDKLVHECALKKFQGNKEEYEKYLKESFPKLAERTRCWHLCYFNDAGNNHDARVKGVAYRINQVIVKELSPRSDGFTYQEISQHAEKEIEFLKEHYKKCSEDVISIGTCNHPGPTTNFGYESNRGDIRAMGVRDDKDAQIIRNAVAVDCSKIAHKAFVLYRGSDFHKDNPVHSEKDKAYSLSYGSGLFAGCLYDGGATAFHYMRKEKNGYAIAVPFEQLHTSPFYTPLTNTVAQLYGNGEIFHARSKIWKDASGSIGVQQGESRRAHLISHMAKDEFISQFQKYKNEAIQLK